MAKSFCSDPVASTEKHCPNCGDAVQPGGRGLGKVFCDKTCRVAFNNRAKAEGAVIVALVKCWLATRHAKPGTREADVCRRARRELTDIGRHLLERDAQAGRPPIVDYVEVLLAEGSIYADRARK